MFCRIVAYMYSLHWVRINRWILRFLRFSICRILRSLQKKNLGHFLSFLSFISFFLSFSSLYMYDWALFVIWILTSILSLICTLCRRCQIDIEEWSNLWKIKCNSNKCEVIPMSRILKHDSVYRMNNEILENVTSFNDIGVLITKDLDWQAHIRKKSTKQILCLHLSKEHMGIQPV